MAWAKEAPKVVEGPKKTETLWEAHYPNSLETWKKDFAAADYKLTSEYDLGEGKILYRFEGPGAPHNVIIRIEVKSAPPA